MADTQATHPWGKFLYDMMSARIAVQAADHGALTGRSKDLLGAATIGSTITGALANDKLLKLTEVPPANVGAFGFIAGGLLLVITGAVRSLRPQVWYFAPDAEAVTLKVSQKHSSWTVDEMYASVAAGLRSAISSNNVMLQKLSRWVRVQLFGLIAIATGGAVLAFQSLTQTA